MEYRNLGNTELRVSVLGLGCSRVGRAVFEDNHRGAAELLEVAFDAGINFFDLASTYTYGNSEKIVGKTFANRRDRVILATKGGFQYSTIARYARFFLPVVRPVRRSLFRRRPLLKRYSKKRQNFSTDHLKKSLEGSLRRLRTDYVDVYQLHSPHISVIESEEVIRFLEDLISEGKTRYCGASVSTITEARACLRNSIFSALQISFNLVEQEPGARLFADVKSSGVGVIVKTPLHRGILTEKYRVTTGPNPEQPDPELETRRRQALSFLLSGQHNSIEMAAIRFVLDHSNVATVLTGTCNPDHLRSNIAAAAADPLPESVMAKARQLQRIEWGLSESE